jgi:hypothetical protein
VIERIADERARQRHDQTEQNCTTNDVNLPQPGWQNGINGRINDLNAGDAT